MVEALRNWAIVLAGGEGVRLASLTSALYGRNVPKQFAVLAGKRSLLEDTLERIGELFAPERTVVIVGAAHAELARRQLARFAGCDVVLQPRNLGTGPGLLLALARILARDRDARVAVFPADHHVTHPVPLLEAVDNAMQGAAHARFSVALVGIVPDRPEVEFGWIEPGPRLSCRSPAIQEVQRFVEKPSLPLAERLYARGALWNSFISVGRLAEFWALLRAGLPRQSRLFEVYAQHVGRDAEKRYLEDLYSRVEPGDFSRDVLERAGRLAVLPVAGSGWSDWGSPERVFRSLEGTKDHARLLERVSGVRGGATPRAGRSAVCASSIAPVARIAMPVFPLAPPGRRIEAGPA